MAQPTEIHKKKGYENTARYNPISLWAESQNRNFRNDNY